MDLLNLAENTDHSYESLGGWTFEYADYTNAGMVGPITQSPEFARLADIVDPYSYLTTKSGRSSPWPAPHFETVPKMVVDGGNDEFFLPDDNHIWWPQVHNEKHLLHIPNADHPLSFLPANASTGVKVFTESLLSFYGAVVHERPRPSFTWTISEDGHSITVGNFSIQPKTVSVWAATTTDGYRDFRLYNCRGGRGKNCTSATPGADGGPQPHVVRYEQSLATPVSHGVWVGRVAPPPAGQWTSFLVDVKFGVLEGGFHFTTQMSIVPVERPYAPCTAGVNCTRLV
jgi:PhoPQ-activated pathogenicity-related protein